MNQHDINQGTTFPSNYAHFISQSQSFPYQNPKLLKHITNSNTNTNSTYLFQKQFKQTNDDASHYLNMSSQHNKSLGEHLIKRIHNDNVILTNTFNNQHDIPVQLFANNNNRDTKGLRKNIINYTYEAVHNKEHEDDIITTAPTSSHVDNSKAEYLEVLKEENSNLRYTNFVYKQLLDNVLFFINSLSKKYSFTQPIYPITYYFEHVDELTKCLLELDKCIASGKNNTHRELQFETAFQIVNECEMTITNSNSGNKDKDITMCFMQEQVDKQRIVSNLNHSKYSSKCSMSSNNNNTRSLSNISRYNSNKTISKIRLSKRKDCIACLLGAGTSKRGYSSMKFNSYGKHSLYKSKISTTVNNNNNTLNVNRFNTTSN